jgi:apolipoprotein N-acyltransferase
MVMPLWLRIIFLVLSSAMTVMVFPPAGIWWMGLLAWFPLLWALHGVSPRLGFRLGLGWGVLTYGVTLSWLWTVFGVPAVGLWLLLGCFVGLFGMVYGRLTTERRKALWPGLLAAVVWVGIEYFRGEVFTLRFPWITAGTGLPPNGLSPVIGVYGVTFVVLAGSAWLVTPGWLARFTGVGTLLVMTAFVMGPQLFHRFVGTPVSNGGFKVALVQGESGIFDSYLHQTRAIHELVDAVVWPEHAVGYDVRENAQDMEKLDALVGDRTKMITIGSKTTLEGIKWYNTAITFGAGGEVLGTHDKNHPVHFFDDGERGRDQRPFETPIGEVATPICFDCDYSGVARKLTAAGAEVFLVPSMDPERWTAKQHEQHAVLFRHRAAENHRFFGVASSSGVTQIIDQSGVVVDRLPLMEEGVLVGEVGRSGRMTIFTRIGWILGPLCAWVAGVVLAWVCYGLGREWCERRKAGGGKSGESDGDRAMVRAVDVGED